MKTYKSSSTERPLDVDKDSSKKYVYLNKNIVEEPATGNISTMYRYDVEEYTRLEYLEVDNKQKDSIIESLETKFANIQTKVTNTQLALVEVYTEIKSGGL